jgi:5-methylcytosine-specific restriction enzyme subunit McrC
MFDMNRLWESFVLNELRRVSKNTFSVNGQLPRPYWKPEQERSRSLKPDIVICTENQTVIIDTKWKIPKDLKASNEDIRQMLAYNLYFDSKLSYLLYPGNELAMKKGAFKDINHGLCHVLNFPILNQAGELDRTFAQRLFNVINIL